MRRRSHIKLGGLEISPACKISLEQHQAYLHSAAVGHPAVASESLDSAGACFVAQLATSHLYNSPPRSWALLASRGHQIIK